MSPSISVIMPAYNAERTIELALRSIRMQTIADQIEILVIDGGSTDATREIARQYGAVILENPHRLPEPAKLIGIQRAKGRYVVKQDTDEELIDPRQLERRIEFFSRHPQVRCIVCDEQRPDLNGGISTHYLCTYGDPFTFFVYRQKENILRTFKAAVSERDGNACVLRFAPGDLMPIGDGATTMFDLQWVKEHFADWNTQQFICATSSRILPRLAAAAALLVMMSSTTPAPHSVGIWPNCGSESSTTCFTRRKAASVRGHLSSRAPATAPANTCLYCTPPRWSALW